MTPAPMFMFKTLHRRGLGRERSDRAHSSHPAHRSRDPCLQTDPAPGHQPTADLSARRSSALCLHPCVLLAGDSRHHSGSAEPQVYRHCYDTSTGN